MANIWSFYVPCGHDPKHFTTVPRGSFKNHGQLAVMGPIQRVVNWYLPVVADALNVPPEEMAYVIDDRSDALGHVSHHINISNRYGTASVMSFHVGPQNNCCGATTVTAISTTIRNVGLGHILYYMLEDMARARQTVLLTATDKLSNTVNKSMWEKFGWTVVHKFFNPNSSNNVALIVKSVEQGSSDDKRFVGAPLNLYYDKKQRVEKEKQAQASSVSSIF